MADTITDLLLFIEYAVILAGLRCCIEVDFLARFLQVGAKPAAFAVYVGASLLVSFSLGIFQTPSWIQFCVHLVIMFSAAVILPGKFGITALVPCAILAALFALADALSVSILKLLLYPGHSVWGSIMGAVWGLAAPFAVTLSLLAASFFFLRYAAEKYEKINSAYAISYLHLLLLPCLLIVLLMHFNWGLWDMNSTVDSNARLDYVQMAKDTILLLLAFLSFTAVLAAFFKLTESAERGAEKSDLEQQIKIQRQYVAEARQRNERYRSFHHDITNHFSVLSGLLSAENNMEAVQYLRKIKDGADAALEEIHTGNTVLDVLLGEKISYAKRQGIAVGCNMRFDARMGVDDFDLCVLFANALDNAIRACTHYAGETKDISITSAVKNNFLFIEFENTCTPFEVPFGGAAWGVGLKNMRRTAEKYRGALDASAEGNHFRLSILLCLPAGGEKTVISAALNKRGYTP